MANLPPPPEPTDWSGVSVNTDLHMGTISKSVSELVEKFQDEVKRLYGKGTVTLISETNEKKIMVTDTKKLIYRSHISLKYTQ